MPKLIERISGLLEKATAGRLSVSDHITISHGGGKHGYREIGSDKSALWIARFQAFHDGPLDKVSPEWEANAQLYCELRNAAPALMDALRKAEALVKVIDQYGNSGADYPEYANLRSALEKLDQ